MFIQVVELGITEIIYEINFIEEECSREIIIIIMTASLVQWSACLNTDHEVAGSIPDTSTILSMN